MFWLIGLMVAWLSGSQLCQTIWSPRWQSPFSWRRVPIGVGVVNIAVRRLAPWNGVVLCDGLRLAQGSQVPFVGTIVGSGLGSTCATLRPLSSRDTPASSPACGRHYLRLISPHVTGVYVLRCVLALPRPFLVEPDGCYLIHDRGHAPPSKGPYVSGKWVMSCAAGEASVQGGASASLCSHYPRRPHRSHVPGTKEKHSL